MISKSLIHFNKRSILQFTKFNFARKIKENTPKVQEVVKEEVKIRISPYFSKAVKDKDKSHQNVNIALLNEDATEDRKNVEDFQETQIRERIKTLKQKLDSAKKAKTGKKIGVVMENVKRELPKEL